MGRAHPRAGKQGEAWRAGPCGRSRMYTTCLTQGKAGSGMVKGDFTPVRSSPHWPSEFLPQANSIATVLARGARSRELDSASPGAYQEAALVG